MKKILQALLALVLLSCEKEVPVSSSAIQPQQIQKASITGELSVTTGVITFDEWVVNTCYPENVHLTGNAPYTIRELNDSYKRYYIDYRIDLNNVRGVGETSGFIYKGNGFIDGRVKASRDLSSNRVEGKDTYKLRLIAGSNHMLIREDAHFVQNSNSAVKVEVNSSSYDCAAF
jgi:hypothetical protein